jgi:uncharacterized protein
LSSRAISPRPFRELKNEWIPLSDGCCLGARIRLPEDAEDNPVPALLEYIPYRKDDWTLARDAVSHEYFARRGYASVRVDLRGSGSSEGVLLDEYLPREQEDAVETIAWLASQQWCTGAVGMFGISWGGFNSLQVAARRPPGLKAIITCCASDDRYTDDAHYLGGCVLAYDLPSWAATMLAFNARPPDPAVVGERWRDMWLERLNGTPPFLEEWLSHQARDEYWKQGSVCEDYHSITCPVYVVGGLADGYTNAVPRLLAGLGVPRKGLIGPWAHAYPDDGIPGPPIGFLQEALRWWDHWLKGVENGVMDEPMLRLWIEESVAPRPFYENRAGRWVSEPRWPARTETEALFLASGSLDREPPPPTVMSLSGVQTVGLDAGAWCPYGSPTDLPTDQRREDALSLSFTSEPLDRRVEVVGFPEVTLTLIVDRPRALVAVRLCDVRPEGTSALVARGFLNLAHRSGHERPVPMEPGRPTTVRLQLGMTAYAVPAGHRLRVSVSPSYWPWVWPSPEPVTLTLLCGESRLDLPVRPPRLDDDVDPLPPPEPMDRKVIEALRPGTGRREIVHDVASNRVDVIVDVGYFDGRWRIPGTGLVFGERGTDTYSIVEGEPLSASVRCEREIELSRGDWDVRAVTSTTLRCDAEAFYVTNRIEAYERDAAIFASAKSKRIVRHST